MATYFFQVGERTYEIIITTIIASECNIFMQSKHKYWVPLNDMLFKKEFWRILHKIRNVYSMLLKEKTNENIYQGENAKNAEKFHEICLHTSSVILW